MLKNISARRGFVAGAIAVTLIVAGSGTPPRAVAADRPTIAYITPGLNVPFWTWVSAGVQREAKKAGADVIVYDSHYDPGQQLANMRTAVNRGVTAVVLSPIDTTTTPAALNVAERAKIPVSIAGVGTTTGTYVSFVTSDDYESSKKVGTFMASALKAKGFQKAPVGIITVSLAQVNAQHRVTGFKETIEPTGTKVVALDQAQQVTVAEAYKFATDMLTAHPDIKGIFADYDNGAVGAAQALTALHRSDVILIGFDGSPQTVGEMLDGRIYAINIQPAVNMGAQAFDLLWSSLHGKSVPQLYVQHEYLIHHANWDQQKSKVLGDAFPADAFKK